MELKKYQKKAVDQLMIKIKNAMATPDKSLLYPIKFESPTGSGKTITMAGLAKEIISLKENDEIDPFSFTKNPLSPYPTPFSF